MTRSTPAEIARHAAQVHRSEAAIRGMSDNPCQRRFAAFLEEWAANADARADALEGNNQPDLFGETI